MTCKHVLAVNKGRIHLSDIAAYWLKGNAAGDLDEFQGKPVMRFLGPQLRLSEQETNEIPAWTEGETALSSSLCTPHDEDEVPPNETNERTPNSGSHHSWARRHEELARTFDAVLFRDAADSDELTSELLTLAQTCFKQ